MSATTVQSFYIAYYGRPADPSGLAFWVGRVEAEGGFDSLVAAFGTSAEATELFSGLTDAQKINAVYQATFGRDADAEGLAFYSAGLADGTFNVYDISKRILDGATTGDDAAIVANKITVAQAFTSELAADPEAAAEYVGISATTSAKALVSAVDATAASVTAAQAQISVVLGVTTSMLTTGADDFPGTAGRDKFVGTISNLGGTLQATDKIDGGAGNDRLELAMSTAWTGFTTGSVKDVETLNLTTDAGTTLPFNAVAITGLKNLSLESTVGQPVTFTNLPTGLESISIKGVKSGTVDTAYAATAAEVSGTTNAITLGLDTVGTSTSTRTTVNVGSIETLNIDQAGSNFVTVTGPATKLSVKGAGTIDIGSVPTTVTEFDGSAATGKITAVLNTAATALKSVKAGSSDDTISVRVQDLTANAVLAGGAGADTLKLSGNQARTVEYQMTGFETLEVSSLTQATTLALGKTSDLSKVVLAGGAAGSNTAALALASAGSAALDINTTGVGVTGGTFTSDHSGATTLTIGAGTTVAPNAMAIPFTLSKTSALTVATQPFTNTTSAITAAEATSLNLTVASGKDAAGTEQTLFTSRVSAAKATSATISGEGNISSLELSLPAAKTLSITNGGTPVTALKVSSYTGSNSSLETLTLTSGSNLNVRATNAAFTGDQEFNKLTTLTIAANKGTTTITNNAGTGASALEAVSTVNLSGAGTNSAVTLGDLGKNDNGYGLTITSTGLKGGMTVGDISMTPGRDLSIALAGSTGNVTVGEIGASTTNQAGKVTVTGPGLTDSIVKIAGANTAKDILASGDVSINLSGSKQAFVGFDSAGTAGHIYGDNVNINVSGTASQSKVGEVTAKSSVTLALDGLHANTQVINTNASTTTFNVAVTAGVGEDNITVNATTAAATSVTMSGDLGGGPADVVTVNGTGAKVNSINISALQNYDAATITGSAIATTITGGSGKDVIFGLGGKNELTGGAGADVFYFNRGDSTASTVNTITDFTKAQGDTIVYGGANITAPALTSGNSKEANNVITTVDKDSVVASFSGSGASALTLGQKLAAIRALEAYATEGHYAFFTHDGIPHLFIYADTSANDIAIALPGMALPANEATAAIIGSATADTANTEVATGFQTGLHGFGA
jgi:hypothetical protein